MEYRDEVYFKSNPETEVPFSDAEYADRLRRIREKMRAAKVDTLFLMSPEAMCYVSGYQNEWYQGQSPREWPASSSIAINVDSDKFILFDSEREAILGRIFTCSTDTRYFPRQSMRDGHEFIARELKAAGWLKGTVGMEFRSNRPNRAISQRIEGLFKDGGAKAVVDATDIVREVRWIKSPAEIACLEEAARIGNIGMAAAKAAIRARRHRARCLRRNGRRDGQGRRREFSPDHGGALRQQVERAPFALDPEEDQGRRNRSCGHHGRL